MRAAVSGLAVVLLFPALASSQVYRWEDQRGTLYYTNVPGATSHAPADPLPEAVSAPPAPDVVARPGAITRIAFRPGDPIFVTATIGGSGPLTLILDTGADRTVVAPRALSRLGISIADAPRAEIRGVTGAGQAGVIQVTSLEVGEARVGPLRIIAHDADLANSDGLLGRDFLENFTVTIDSGERMVTLAPK